jgi:hypothetical protein
MEPSLLPSLLPELPLLEAEPPEEPEPLEPDEPDEPLEPADEFDPEDPLEPLLPPDELAAELLQLCMHRQRIGSNQFEQLGGGSPQSCIGHFEEAELTCEDAEPELWELFEPDEADEPDDSEFELCDPEEPEL